MLNKDLKDRILQISYKHNLSHLGSCLTSVDLIEEIYSIKGKDEPFILSCGHSGLALYVVIEKHEGVNAEEIFLHHGVHPDRCSQCHLYFSTGSLGQGLPAAVGMALADRGKNVYCLVSDGECSEGSIYEAINIIKKYKVDNLKLYINFNGYSAYDETDWFTINRLKYTVPNVKIVITGFEDFPFLHGIDAHYYKLKKEDVSGLFV